MAYKLVLLILFTLTAICSLGVVAYIRVASERNPGSRTIFRAKSEPTKIRIKNKRQLWKALYDDERKVVAQMLRDAFNEGYSAGKWDHYTGPMLRTSIVAIAAIVGIVIFVFTFDFGSYLWNYIFGGD